MRRPPRVYKISTPVRPACLTMPAMDIERTGRDSRALRAVLLLVEAEHRLRDRDPQGAALLINAAGDLAELPAGYRERVGAYAAGGGDAEELAVAPVAPAIAA